MLAVAVESSLVLLREVSDMDIEDFKSESHDNFFCYFPKDEFLSS